MYWIDEVFMDATHYLNTYQMTAEELAGKIIRDVLETTGITSTAGIGSESVSQQDCHGHCGETYSRRTGTACGLQVWMKEHIEDCCGRISH